MSLYLFALQVTPHSPQKIWLSTASLSGLGAFVGLCFDGDGVSVPFLQIDCLDK
jgi:hypothetical protein